MMEEGPTTCERCGGALRRVMFAAGIIFKGSGFYKTDSRSAGSTATSAQTANTSPGDGASAAGSGESSGGASSGGDASTKGGTPAPAEGAKGPMKKESAGT